MLTVHSKIGHFSISHFCSEMIPGAPTYGTESNMERVWLPGAPTYGTESNMEKVWSADSYC